MHSGSQMGGILNLVKGINLLVPRNMTKAAGFYNTLLLGDDPAIVVECLNGYRLKEKMPNNLGALKTPIGVVETIKEGTDITLVSYGSTLRIVEQTAKELQAVGIDVEIIDVQSLMPFDLNHDIVKSIAKTNKVMVIDEDVPGGASDYILDKILNKQNAFQYLDSAPKTLTAKPHRPAYGNDGDYFSKPSAEDIFEAVYAVMHEYIKFADPIGLGETPSLILTLIGEVVAPILVLVGFKTKWATLPTIITMLVAAFVVHLNDPLGTKEKSILFLIAFVAILIAGPGHYSYDGIKKHLH